jgi:hypothetical protein
MRQRGLAWAKVLIAQPKFRTTAELVTAEFAAINDVQLPNLHKEGSKSHSMVNAQLSKPIAPAPVTALVEDDALKFDSELEFERAELNALRDIWRQKSASRGYATRADFDARTIKSYMRNLSILDVVMQEDGTRRYRYRYVGSAIVEVFGEQTGKYIDDFVPADKLARWTAVHDLVTLSGRPLRFVVNYTSPQINYLSSECLMLPLSEDGSAVNMMMSFVYLGAKRA